MAKVQTFADKFNKGGGNNNQCSECGELIAPVKLITSEKSEKTGAWRFNQRFVGICKCTEKEITG